MRVSIDELVQELQKTVMICNSVYAYDRKKYMDECIDIMRKYQKIMQLFNMYQVTHMKKLYLTSGFENALCEVIEGWE